MYNRLYKYLSEHSCLYEKQICFQTAHSTDYAMIQVKKTLQGFNGNEHTFFHRFQPIFIDLSKVFNTVQKLELSGIKTNNLKWFQGYLRNRKLFIKFSNKTTTRDLIQTGIPQGSLLGPL